MSITPQEQAEDPNFTPESVFGNITVASDVEYAVRDLLQKWFPTYLREVERQTGWEGEELPSPRNYTNRNEFDALPGEELPKVVVISPGLLEEPTHPEGGGYYRAVWHLGIGVATAAQTEEEADRKVKMYGAAARAILVQNQSVDGFAIGVHWEEEKYDDLPIEDQHANYKAANIFFGIEVENAVNRWMGPDRPDESPQLTGQWQTVITEFPQYELEVTAPD
jgi:hypothetical protein